MRFVPSVVFLVACDAGSPDANAVAVGAAGNDLHAIMASRGLTEIDVINAAKTYTPSGKHDEYVVFASGGQSGNMIAIGVPSMRILKYIAVFGPEPWQGYGYGGLGDDVLYRQGAQAGKIIDWGDVHHPNLSETAGEYDGEFLFVKRQANAGVAVIDLKDFTTSRS